MIDFDPNKIYTISDIVKNKYFPWLKSHTSIAKWINNDLNNRNILKATRVGTGTGVRYYIKGENILNFIAAFEDGTLHETPRKGVSDVEETTTEEVQETSETTEQTNE